MFLISTYLKAHGQVLRSKQIWTEDGEKNLRFFLNLEKRNYCNKLITSLEVDGKIIKDQLNKAKLQKIRCELGGCRLPNGHLATTFPRGIAL